MSTTHPKLLGYRSRITYAEPAQVIPTFLHPDRDTAENTARQMQGMRGYVRHVTKPVYAVRADA